MFEGITIVEIIALLGALGVGGMFSSIIKSYFEKDRTGAETDEIESRTKRSISEIVESQTRTLKSDFEAQVIQIEKLRAKVAELESTLNENIQYKRIKVLEADVKFWRRRAEILQTRLDVFIGIDGAEHSDETP